MAALAYVTGQVDGAQQLCDHITEAVAEGRLAEALDLSRLLVRILDGEEVPCCLECDLPLVDEDRDAYTSWCAEHAPALALRWE